MKPIWKIVIAVNLVALAVLTWVYAHQMVAPGNLIAGHQSLETDCFACHTPFLGASAERCVVCHKPADIGLKTTQGAPLTQPLTRTPFHQQLTQNDCTACHSDHAGVKRFRTNGQFDHALLTKAAAQQCQSCHKPPKDSLHSQLTPNCSQCHTQDRWSPATFNHDKYFELDRDHNARCVTCHVGNDYSRYTCYGCHEHTVENIRRKHIKEGIRQFNNCVECHRNSNEHDIRRPGSAGADKGDGAGGQRDAQGGKSDDD